MNVASDIDSDICWLGRRRRWGVVRATIFDIPGTAGSGAGREELVRELLASRGR